MATVIDKKTGRKRRVDPKRSRAAKMAARKRKKTPMPKAQRLKISRGVKRALRTGKTENGRRVIRKRRK